MSDSAGGAPVERSDSRWTERETEFLSVTLRLLQKLGYERLTVDAVAAETKSSKTTIYRRWPSKADLVLAAFIEGTRLEAEPPNTGSLREDLLQLGAMACAEARRHSLTINAIMTEVPHSPVLGAALQGEFRHQRKQLMVAVFANAIARGEIDPSVLTDELWDVLPGYLVFRCTMSGLPPDDETVRMFVDNVLIPALTHTRTN
jgi:AcrR family transcriptional regulator